MMAAVLALQLSMAPSVIYQDVPAAVVRVSVLEWRDDRPPAAVSAPVEKEGSRVTVRGVAGRRRLVILERSDGAYLVDGPFWWPSENGPRLVDRQWRRTIQVASPDSMAGASPLEWLSGDAEPSGEWPRCMRTDDRRWSCWGTATGQTGVVVCRVADRVWWSIVASASPPDLRSSRWARLLIVREPTGDAVALRVQLARPVPPPAQRLRSLRLDTAPVADARSSPLGAGRAWLSGDEVPAKAWAEIRTKSGGPVYLALEDVAEGPPSLPLIVQVEETRAIDGLVLGAGEEPASGALVTLFRLIDPPPIPGDRSRDKPRRVLVAETRADTGGAFHLDGAGEADYEVVAWHSQLGRASAPVPGNARPFVVRLAAAGVIRGRVLAGGKPLAGVDVVSLPGLDAFMSAEDLTDVKGGDARSGGDGRFAVIAAAGGGGELRVGGGTYPIKRISLPRVPAPLLDLGNIELGAPLEITIVLDQDSACDVRGTGPVGQSGLQIVTGTRTGPGLYRMTVPEPGLWAFGLLCGRDERALSPTLVPISSAQAGKEVRFSIR